MSLIYWIFVVDLNKLACVVVNFLIKSHCHLVGVNLFYVSSLPPLPALNIKQYRRPPEGRFSLLANLPSFCSCVLT